MGQGSGWPLTNKVYGPVKLKIRAISKLYLCGNSVPHFRCFDATDRFKEVWGMFARDEQGERRFYLLPPNSDFAYMLLRGKFEILFDATLFFKIMDRASKKNINAFWKHAVLSDLEELSAFAELMLNSKWPDRKRRFALDLMGQLERAYEKQFA